MRMIAVVVAALLAVPAVGQESHKPGPEHANLKAREGTWDLVMKFGDTESKGTITYKMEIGGLWLVSSMDSELFGQKFSGKGLDTYDPAKKKYVSVWVDSMSAGPVLTEGTYDKDKKTLTMSGPGPGHDGPATKYKSVSVMKDDDTEVMSMTMGDAKEPTFTITYKRKK